MQQCPKTALNSNNQPYDVYVNNCFNDATSVEAHLSNYGSHGHEGIDFYCAIGVEVVAMYEGEVTEVRNLDIPPAGKYVKIRSELGNDAGFETSYLHLSQISVQCGQIVSKGQRIGASGNTGNVGAHLHVHLRPFDGQGDVPRPYEESTEPAGWVRGEPLTPPIRVRGCMNFACFLPPDDSSVPALTSTGRILTPRDASALLPVFAAKPEPGSGIYNPQVKYTDDAETPRLRGWIKGSKIGCYAILATEDDTTAGISWHRIQFTDDTDGWVPSRLLKNGFGMPSATTRVHGIGVEGS